MNNGKYLYRIDPWGILAVIIPFSVYLLTLAPTVTFFDSGEFITAIYSLGSAHSPGYPTFINFARPFTYLPFGSIAFRVNIATAFSAALACYAVYLLVCRFLEKEELADDPAFSALWDEQPGPIKARTTSASARRFFMPIFQYAEYCNEMQSKVVSQFAQLQGTIIDRLAEQDRFSTCAELLLFSNFPERII